MAILAAGQACHSEGLTLVNMTVSPDHKLPPLARPWAPAAPELTKHGRCSDCNVTAVLAGSGDLKVCPTCHALLWHRDWSGDDRRRKETAATAIEAARAAAREATAQRRRQIVEAKREELKTKNEPP